MSTTKSITNIAQSLKEQCGDAFEYDDEWEMERKFDACYDMCKKKKDNALLLGMYI